MVTRGNENCEHATEVIHVDMPHSSEGFSLDFGEVPDLIEAGWHAADIRLASDYASDLATPLP